jgi:stearoyl-CoA desaturase (delta-9 desaturase)
MDPDAALADGFCIRPEYRMATAVTPSPAPILAAQRLPYPPTLEKGRFIWPYVGAFALYHTLALIAIWPWLFTWTGLALWLTGFYVFGTLGINLCYHRLLTHYSFKCPKWLEHTLAIIGVCCLQDTPARWVGVHRRHHQHSDEPADPHSPLVTFFWGHMEWLIHVDRELERKSLYEHYAKDLLQDRFYRNLERRLVWVWINLAQWIVYYLAGFIIGLLTSGGELWEGVRFGLSLLVWGCILRTVCVWHITWSVNSVTHLWGYRNYDTDENSKNNVFVGILSNGEGWHNNHHAQPRCAAHGHKWWEFDVTWITVWLLQKVGLAWDVVPINKKMARKLSTSAKEY